MADRAARSVLEFVTTGDAAVVAAYDKIGKKAKDTSGSVAGLSRNLGTLVAGFTAASLIERGVRGIFAYGQAAFESAGQILDLSNRTGLATETIQRMQNVANQTGSSLEAFTNAAFKLGVNVSEGMTKTRQAVKDLGLSYTDLAALRPDEQFARVVKALEGVESQQERNRLGVALFGRQFSEIAASIEEGYTGIADAAKVSTDDQLHALDAAGDAWQQFTDDVTSATRTALGEVVLFVRDAKAELGTLRTLAPKDLASLLGIAVSGLWSPAQIIAALASAGAASREAGKDIELGAESAATGVAGLREQLTATQQEIAGLTSAQRADLDAAIRLGKSYEDVARSVSISEEAFNLYKKQVQESTQAAKLHATAQEQLAAKLREFHNFVGEREIAAAEAAQERLTREQAAWRAYYNWLGERRMENEAAELAAQLRIATGAKQMFQTMMSGGAAFNGTGAWMNRPTVPMDSPTAGGGGFFGRLRGLFGGGAGGAGGGFMSGVGGQMLGSGLGLLSGLIPGQSGLGTQIGSIAGMAFGPLGSMLGGLSGGLIGRLFGGGEAGKTKKARDEWIESVGGLDKLKDMAASAGVSLDKLFSAKKVKDFEAEAKRVMAAIESHQQKVAALEQERNDLIAERDRLEQETTVSFDQMSSISERFGINQDALGGQFQQGRTNRDAKELIDAIEVMRKGGAEMNVVFLGMSDEISKLIQDSAKYGTEVPENLKPVIESLFAQGALVDENGEKLKKLPNIKFGEAIKSEMEKASDKLAEVVDRLADVLSQLTALDGKKVSFDVEGRYHEEDDTVGRREGEGYKVGTLGRTGSFWHDFGRATRTVLHGVEAVVRPDQSLAFARSILGGAGEATSTPLMLTMDGQVVARAMIRRTGRQLALVGA